MSNPLRCGLFFSWEVRTGTFPVHQTKAYSELYINNFLCPLQEYDENVLLLISPPWHDGLLCNQTVVTGERMPTKTFVPKCCPVCGGDSLQPVERHSLGTAEADTKTIVGVLGFRCGKGHVFLVNEADIEEKNPKDTARSCR
jgi:hypothetical protein